MGASMVMDGTTVTLLRREDMLVLEVGFVNVRRTVDVFGATVLIPADAAAPAAIEVTFPPQALLEALGFDFFGAISDARFSGPTRLAFEFPPGTVVPFTVGGLLGWADLTGSPERTAVECVWDLTFRPTAPDATWAHASAPVTTTAGVTELWHTRLMLRDDADPHGVGGRRPVALGSAQTSGLELPFVSSLSKEHRADITRAVAVRPVQARELSLSALGATVDLAGDWADALHLSLVEYRHRAVLGRDESVGTVERGYLFPFGFQAQLVTHTERVLGTDRAVLKQIEQLTVLIPEVHYDGAVGVPFDGRDFPFRRVSLDGPLTAEVRTGTSLADGASWVDSPSGGRLAFSLTAEDREGHTVSFRAPLVFVGRTHAFGGLEQVVDRYDQERREVPAPAAGRVSLAPSAGGGTSAVDVTALYVGARVADADADTLRAAGQLAAFPRLVGVDARIPALEAFSAGGRPRAVSGVVSGTVAGDAVGALVDRASATLRLDEAYVRSGLDGPGIYARLKDQVAFAPPVTSVGGLAALSVPVSGLSSTAGLVGGELEAFRNGQFDPATYFKAAPNLQDLLPPKLLGFLDLAELVEPARVGDGEETPRVVTEVLRPDGDPTGPPDRVRSTVTWRPKVKAGLHAGTLRTTPGTTLDLRSTTVVHLDGRDPSSDVRGELRSFSLEFAGGVLIVRFERLAFTSRSGTPPALDVKVAEVGFGGDLRFLDALRKYLPSPPNGPRVTVTARGLEASHTLAIPTVSTGVFLLQNLALSASVTLPLDNPIRTPSLSARAVRARFAVSSRDDPFLVTVSLFGGGGFVALEVESGRIETLEAQLEFGAATSLNLGIASASVAVTAGVYIRLDGAVALLTGFLRAVGELDVLGLVNVSVEIYLGIGYRDVPKNPADPDGPTRPEAHGIAMLTVRVRVLFFSESVTLTVERSFGGGDDPTFDVVFPSPEPWRQRCAAFAPMVES